MAAASERAIEIRRISAAKEWDEFLELPARIHASDRDWAPQLRTVVRRMLDVGANPFFKHGYACPLVAYRAGIAVGRLVVFINETHNKIHRDAVGFFGFFECENDPASARALFSAGERWLSERGMDRLRGPISPAPHFEVGVKIGSEGEPAFLTSDQPDYYLSLLESVGLRRFKDLLAYEINSEGKVSERLLKHGDRVKKARGVTLRPLNQKNVQADLEQIRVLYNSALEEHWGFVPLGREEFGYLMHALRPILDPELLLIAEVRGKPAGFALAIPDLNPVLRKIGSGKLGPMEYARLWWNLRGPGRKLSIRRCRVVALGVRKEYAHFGIGPLLYSEYLNRGPAAGYLFATIPDIPEENGPMNRALTRLCGSPREKHRMFEKKLGGGA